MENISELLTGLTGALESQVRTQITNNWPATPTAILYANEKAYEAHGVIMQTLRGVWRGRAEDVCQMVIRDGEYHLPLHDGGWKRLEADEVQERLDDLFAREQSFRTMNELLLVMVQNTAGCAGLEQFREEYMAVDRLKEQLGMSACNTMKILFLDESGRGRALAGQIRTCLREAITKEEPGNRATAILSNRLKSGVLLTGGRIHENYALAGNLILLANNSNNYGAEAFKPRYSAMFPVSTRRFITASYTHDSRPNKAICEVLINTTLSWLEEKFGKGDLLTVDEMSKRLEISGGTVKVLDTFFQQYVADKLPPRETLEYLPRAGLNLDLIGSLPFREYDRVTMGGFSAFYDTQVLGKCASESVKRQFREYFTAQMTGRFTPKEAARSITVQTVDQVLGQLRREEPDEGRPAFEYMIAKARLDYYKMVTPIYREIILSAGTASREHIKDISDISQEFQHNYMLDIDDTVQRYYRELALEKLNGTYGEQLLAVFNKPELTRANMLEALEQAIKLIFSSHQIFGMSMVKELIMRMGGNSNMVQPIIQELTDDLGDGIRLQTAIVPEILFKTMLVDQQESELYDILKTIISNADSLNTGNSNGVEFVQLYAVDSHTL